MSIHTILLKLDDEAAAPALIDVARSLAERLDAHLIGMHVIRPEAEPSATVGRTASAGFSDIAQEMAHERAHSLKSLFRAAMDETDLAWSWAQEQGDMLEAVVRRTLFADLLVARRNPARDIGSQLTGSFDDHLVVEAACPVLLMPDDKDYEQVGRHVMIAWKPEREAARTLRNALPLLRRAQSVTVVSVGRHDEPAPALDDLMAYLDRFGVRAERRMEISEKGEAGVRLLEVAAEIQSDLIVMGAYGRSRLRELLSGGVTRDVLGALDAPCLLSH